MNHYYILIMAGGSGTRLFPFSRDNSPKHLITILGKKTLLAQTYDRAKKIVPLENIYISTNRKYISAIKKQLPGFPASHMLAEPTKKNTGPAMALCVTLIAQKDPKAIVATTPTDHQLKNPAALIRAFKTAFKTISLLPNNILIIGIHPDSPNTGYGYIQLGKLVSRISGQPIYQAASFKEKPDLATAENYLSSGDYLWNTSYFVFSAQHFLDEVTNNLPEVSAGLQNILSARGTKTYQSVLDHDYSQFPNIAVDNAIIEKTHHLLVLPANLGWCDIGSWDTVISLIDQTKLSPQGNYAQGLHIPIDSQNTIVFSQNPKKLIATIGLKDVTIIDTNDATLVVAKGQSQKVKQVVDEIKKRKLEHLL